MIIEMEHVVAFSGVRMILCTIRRLLNVAYGTRTRMALGLCLKDEVVCIVSFIHEKNFIHGI